MSPKLTQQERNLLVFFILNEHLRSSILADARTDKRTSKELLEAYEWALHT